MVTWQGCLDAFAYAHLLGHLLTPPHIILQVPEARHLRPPLASRPAVAQALPRRVSPRRMCWHGCMHAGVSASVTLDQRSQRARHDATCTQSAHARP